MNKLSILRALAAVGFATLVTVGSATPAQAATATNIDYQISGTTVTVTVTPGTSNLTDFCADYNYPGNSSITNATPGQTAALLLGSATSFVFIGANDEVLTYTPAGNTRQLSGLGKGSFTPSTTSTQQVFTFTIPASVPSARYGISLTCVDSAKWVINWSGGLTQTGTRTYDSNVVSNVNVTFDANGGSGAMAVQSASTATNLSTNAFTRSGYTFTGWNTAADGTGTAYADGASYPFGSSTRLYAQWTSVLAKTGTDSSGYLVSSAVLLAFGAGLVVLRALSRKKALNS
ncbi:InlB B-repeat-containing protein [Aurantimicrobium minutum]|uniref:InlB B-repeat-containing protein n=1 Tax=Aurantimicrobium minutum TaxID=708131 RepID=UPI00248EA101|nr:InlB B-repeat-containing protein [Aurantimicrobium minutum]